MFRARYPLAVVVLLLTMVPSVCFGTGQSRFERTVMALQTASAPLQARFASLALMELAETYIAEADLARSEASSSEQPARLRSWSLAVGRYAEDLFTLVAAVDAGAPVTLRLHEMEVPSVSVDGRTVMLAHPRSDQQAGYEQRLLQQFCTGTTCTALTASELDQPIPASPQLVTPVWRFSDSGPQCEYRGLSVQFERAEKLASQKSLCGQLMQEAEMLAVEIAWQQRHDVAVEWGALRVQATPGQPAHLVTLSASGDSILLSLPLIGSTEPLLAALTPWLQQRFLADGPGAVALNARELGWE